MHGTIINEKEVVNLKESKEGYLWGFRGRNRKREMVLLHSQKNLNMQKSGCQVEKECLEMINISADRI